MAETVERLAVLIEANTKQFENAMKRLEKVTQQSMNKSTKAVRSLDATLGQLSGTFVNFARGFLVGAAATFLYQLPKAIGDIVQEADKLAKTAATIGITTDALQELTFAAGKAGVGAGVVDKSLQGFSRRVAEAAAGQGDLAKILSANGVELRNQDGTLRNTVDVLGDYADLIRGAASEQDKLYLATKAFGEEGAGLVNLLRGGAGALVDLRAEAHTAGAVIREDLLKSAEDINDRWTELNANISTRFKTAVLTSVGAIDTLVGKLQETNPVVESWLAKWAKINPLIGGAVAGAIGIGGGAGLRDKADPVADLLSSVDKRLAATTTEPPATPTKPTIIPTTVDPATKKIQDVIDALKLQQEQLTRTDREQEIYNQLARAGVDANSAAGQQIAALTGAYYDQAQAIERARTTANFFAETTADALMSVLPAVETGNKALDSLLNTLIKAVAQAALLGTGPLANLFGGASSASGVAGGILGSLFGGFRAGGGPVMAGKAYVVGERGPELMVSPSAGRIIPANQNGASGGMATVRIVASKEFEAHIEEVSGRVSVQTTGAGLASYDQQTRRKQKLAG